MSCAVCASIQLGLGTRQYNCCLGTRLRLEAMVDAKYRSAISTLASNLATCLIRIHANVDMGWELLPSKELLLPRSAQEVAPYALQQLPVAAPQPCHLAARLLAGVLDIHPILSEIIAARCKARSRVASCSSMSSDPSPITIPRTPLGCARHRARRAAFQRAVDQAHLLFRPTPTV